MPVPDITRARRTAAAAIVFDQEGRILLHRRTDNGRWGLPGGSIEVGEKADEAVIREVKEETGYDVSVVRLIGIYSDPVHTTMTYPDGNTVAYVSLLFECAVLGGSPQLSDESSAVDWFAPDSLPQPFHSGHLPRVQDALSPSGSLLSVKYQAELILRQAQDDGVESNHAQHDRLRSRYRDF